MNHATIPITCGLALAMMAGAVGSHYAAVDQMMVMAEFSKPTMLTPIDEVLVSGKMPTSEEETRFMIAELQRQNVAMQQSLARTQPGESRTWTTNGSSDLNKALGELVALNRDLRSQIAETNRDLMELRFQVDSHSEQFRPLNTIEEQQRVEELDTYDPSIGVLPPLDLP